MKGFSHRQLKKLATPLDETRVQRRVQGERSFSYIEGWFAVSEANRIFGYDGWDRETADVDCVFDNRRNDITQCGYAVRVRLRVRAQGQTITREGTGFGQASAAAPGDAHERALKAAETDATKRALATFGGRFGLLLHDKERAGDPLRGASAEHRVTEQKDLIENGATFELATGDGKAIAVRSAEAFCSAFRQLCAAASDTAAVRQLRDLNAATLRQLRTQSGLRTLKGVHYVDILERLVAQRMQALEECTRLAPTFDAPAKGEAPVSLAEVDLSDPPRGADGAAGDAAAPVRDGAEEGPSRDANAIAGTLPAASGGAIRPFVSVPPYPLAQVQARFGSAGQGTVVAQPASLASAAGDDGRARHAAPATPTRRSQISGGFSVDKSVLLVPSERRLRSKKHLAMVAARPCVICEDGPCHAHHVTFAQPRGLSQKVSDEFAVPLCVPHHNALHASHNEASWWRAQGVDPLPVAQHLWAETMAGGGNGR
ncbi:MAG: DUF968 domain-containing protein [Proteobacteria bacterium]|nr:DUF968 domain-containing protein [Pseudomonadota bacterium]